MTCACVDGVKLCVVVRDLELFPLSVPRLLWATTNEMHAHACHLSTSPLVFQHLAAFLRALRHFKSGSRQGAQKAQIK
jgi:hypothetical protein